MRATTTPEKTPRMLSMVSTLLRRQPSTLAVALVFATRDIFSPNSGRELLPPSWRLPRSSGDEERDRSPEPRRFFEADLLNEKTSVNPALRRQ